MPFTLSHPAAVLPLRRFGVFSALIFGSMAPDFLYFIPGHAYARYGHTARGLIFFCIPASWSALWIFHIIMKHPLAELLPEAVAAKLRAAIQPFDFGFWPFDILRILAISLSILAGGVTHILWDACTHSNGFIAERVTVLMDPVFSTSFGTVLWVQVVQELSSSLGAAVLAWGAYCWQRDLRGSRPVSAPRLTTVQRDLMLFLMLILTLAYSLPLGLRPIHYRVGSYQGMEFFLRIAVVTSMRTYFLLLLAYCIAWQAWAARRPTQTMAA